MSYPSECSETLSASAGEHRFSTRDLVVIAMLSALGGVLSTYVGYLGNLVNRVLGIPFGAGQFMAGLHVLWMVLAHGILMKRGVSSATGTLKGLVEMFMGSTHGVVIVVVSGLQGIIYDAGMAVSSKNYSISRSCLVAGLSSASNVAVFSILYLRAVPLPYIILMGVLAFFSGIIFAGYFGNATLEDLAHIGMADMRHITRARFSRFGMVIGVVFVALLSVGAAYYFSGVYTRSGAHCSVEGDVAFQYTYYPEDFRGHEVTLVAELQGSYTYVAPSNYTGVPLSVVLGHARPSDSASRIMVISGDGYSAEFMLDVDLERIILVQEEGNLRLVAADFEGAYWVRDVARLVVS